MDLQEQYNGFFTRFKRLANDKGFWTFVTDHIADNISKLRLKYQRLEDDIDYPMALTQIECRQRFGAKFAETLSRVPYLLFPDELVGEQATSDRLARYHASLVEPGSRVVDLTAGLGIDLMHIAERGCNVAAVELDPRRAAALAVNLELLGVKPTAIVCGDCRDVLGQLDADVVFIDPARRAMDGSRVFSLHDCAPDVTEIYDELRHRFKRLFVKISPMLDISAVASELPGLKTMSAVGTPTECRELLSDCNLRDENIGDTYHIYSVTLTDNGEMIFTYSPEQESEAEITYGSPKIGDDVYIPFPVMMKSGAVKLIAARYGLTKIAPNTHIYFRQASTNVNGMNTEAQDQSLEYDDIQAVKLKVIDIIPWQSKQLKRFSSRYPRGWVATRNMGVTAQELAKKLSVKPGGDLRILGLTDNSGSRLVLVLK
ncbi:MAG: hypothetical protein J6C44_00880 [Muribaculaceae bacterium]|nr:hypothetical protein [Muribaculaceae bacterium]